MNYRSILQSFLVLAVLAASSAFAGASMKTFIGADSTDFSDDDNWSPTGVPVATDNIIISVPCTIDSAMNDALTYGALSFSSGSASLSWTDNTKVFKITIVDDSASASGATLNMTGGGTLQLTGSGTGLFDLSNITFTNGTGTIEYASTDNQTVSGEDYNNLKISGNRGTEFVTFAMGSTIGIKNNLDISELSFDPFPLGGFIDPTTSTVVYNGTGAQTVAAIPYFNLTITDSRSNALISFESDPAPGSPFAKEIVIGGVLNIGTSGLTWNPQLSTVVFGGVLAQTIPTQSGFDFFTLKLANPSGVAFTNGETYRVRGNFQVAPASYTGTNVTFNFNGSGPQLIDAFPFHNLTISGTGPIGFNVGTTSVSNTFTNSAAIVSFNPLSIFDYNGDTSQTILALPYANLTISGDKSNDTVIFTPGITSISGAFDVSASGTPAPIYVTTSTTIEFNGTSMPQSIPGVFSYATLRLSGAAPKTIGTASVTATTLNNAGSSLEIQPTFNLTISELIGTGTIEFANNTASLSIIGTANSGYGGTFEGAGAISKTGTGILTLSMPSPAFTGTFDLQSGRLELNDAQALGTAGTAGDITISGSPTTLVIDGFALPNLVNANGGAPVITGNANSGAKVKVFSTTNLSLGTDNVGDQFSVVLLAGSPGTTASFTGPGNLILQHNSTDLYDGSFSVNNGYVRLESANSLGLATSTVTINDGAFLASNTAVAIPQNITLNGGTLQVTGGNDRKYSGNITSNNPMSKIRLFDAADGITPRSFEISGQLTSGTALSISGPPAPMTPPLPPPPVLKVSNMFSGSSTGIVNIGTNAEVEIGGTGSITLADVVVNTGGLLTLVNTVSNTSVNIDVNTGGTLRGTAQLSGASSIDAIGGTILPGPLMGTGVLPVTPPGTLTLNSTSQVVFRAGAPGTNDRINVGGNLTLDGLFNIAPLPGFGAGTYTLFQHGGLTNNTIDLPPAPPGLSFALDTTTMSNEVRLVVTALPITITSPATFSGMLNENVTYPITVTAPPAPPAPSVLLSTTTLPPGLRLEGTNIVGSPTIAGSYTFTITATNGFSTGTLLVTFMVDAPNNLSLGDFSAEGKVGTPFYLDVTTRIPNTNGVSFTIVPSLPPGLTLTSSGIIKGTPTVADTTSTTYTVTATNNTGSGSGTVTITILAKTETVGPQLTDLLVDPEKPGINELVLFSVNTFSPENLITTVSWDFGDGTTGSGEFVEKSYSAAGTYSVTVTATAGGKSTSTSQLVEVSNVDPDAPLIDTATASPAPSVTGQLVTFTASGSDANNDALTYEWNFGTGEASVTGNPLTFTYTQAGQYLVTVKVTDATGKSSRTTEFTHLVGDGTGVSNEGNNDEVVSFDGIKQKITFSEDGLIGLTLDINSLTRELLEASTDFGTRNFRNVSGESPSVKIQKSGLSVAKTTVREKATRKERGKARKTLAVSARELGETPKVETEPEDKGVSKLKMKGDFFPSRNGAVTGTLSRATKEETLKSDKLTASGSITMPGGLDMTNGTEIEVALGNIIDKVVIDAKGKGKGRFTTLQMRIKTDKTTKKSVGDVAAKFSIKMSVADMVADGFDTEGVVVSKEQNGKPLSIQAALMIGGVVYTADNPVTLKVSPKEDKAQMITRSSGAN